MKKLFIAALFTILAGTLSAQTNFQLHYDFGNNIYGTELSNRPKATATVENFTADKWGSTYFFIDANIADNQMASAYAEISRELKFWDAPFAMHIEYNGGLSGYGSYNDAYLFGQQQDSTTGSLLFLPLQPNGLSKIVGKIICTELL